MIKFLEILKRNARDRISTPLIKSNFIPIFLIYLRISKCFEEKKDKLLGYYHIIYEEYLESLLLIPHWILLPVKVITLLLFKLDQLNNNNLHWPTMKFIPGTIFCDLYQEIFSLLNTPVKYKYFFYYYSF